LRRHPFLLLNLGANGSKIEPKWYSRRRLVRHAGISAQGASQPPIKPGASSDRRRGFGKIAAQMDSRSSIRAGPRPDRGSRTSFAGMTWGAAAGAYNLSCWWLQSGRLTCRRPVGRVSRRSGAGRHGRVRLARRSCPAPLVKSRVSFGRGSVRLGGWGFGVIGGAYRRHNKWSPRPESGFLCLTHGGGV
jgi:hypothetical protein